MNIEQGVCEEEAQSERRVGNENPERSDSKMLSAQSENFCRSAHIHTHSQWLMGLNCAILQSNNFNIPNASQLLREHLLELR